MRAVSYAEFGGPEVLHVAEVPVPEPGVGQVLGAGRGVGRPSGRPDGPLRSLPGTVA